MATMAWPEVGGGGSGVGMGAWQWCLHNSFTPHRWAKVWVVALKNLANK